jgi:hypothetical protein
VERPSDIDDSPGEGRSKTTGLPPSVTAVRTPEILRRP